MNADRPNASSFVRATSIPTARRGALVGAHGDEHPAGRRVAQPRDEQPDQADDDQHEDAEDHARVGVALGDPDVEPEDRRRRDVAARAGRR